jgi:ElaB/YqjD/DUF883 family membrane-anchored ribosome-binding protein
MAEPAMPIDDPNREPPAHAVGLGVEPRTSSTRLNQTADALGSAVGSAVENVRHLPQRLQEMKQRFTVIRGRTQKQAASKAADLKETARERAQAARTVAAYYAREYPLHVIAGAAGVGFILGIALRIWRSPRG